MNSACRGTGPINKKRRALVAPVLAVVVHFFVVQTANATPPEVTATYYWGQGDEIGTVPSTELPQGCTCGAGCAFACGTPSAPGGFNDDFAEEYSEAVLSQNMSLMPSDEVYAKLTRNQKIVLEAPPTVVRAGSPGAPVGVHAGDRQGRMHATNWHDTQVPVSDVLAQAEADGESIAADRPVSNENDNQGELAPRFPEVLADRAIDFLERLGEASDPVHPGRGEFTYDAVDLTLPGHGLGFQLKRFYRSRSSHRSTLGTGWTHSFDQYIVQESTASTCGSGRVQWHTGDGSFVVFEASGGRPLRATNGLPYLISAGSTTFTITGPDYTTYTFDTYGPLKKIQDRAGHQIDLEWEQYTNADNNTTYRVKTVTDTVGRKIDFFYDSRSFIDYVRVAPGVQIDYQVDVNGDLSSVTTPDNIGETYEYLSGYVDTAPFVPTQLLDAFCDDRCDQADANCSNGTQCQSLAKAGIPACVEECLDPATCKSGCAAACSSACTSQPAVSACTSSGGVCRSTCQATCLARGEDFCDDLEDGDTGYEPFWRQCQVGCSEVASAICDATVSCYLRYGNLGLAAGESAGTYGLGINSSITDPFYCVGYQQCRAARPFPWASRHDPRMIPSLASHPGMVLATAPWPIGDCNSGCYDCILHGSCPKFNGASPRAENADCTDLCRTGLRNWCDDNVVAGCPLACDKSCTTACTGQCASSCTANCNDTCDDKSTCESRCTSLADRAASNCELSCRDECRTLWKPPSTPMFGHLSDLNHNLTRVRRGGELHVDNTYQTNASQPDFDRVTRQVFGGDTIDYSFYDIATRYRELQSADATYVTLTPSEVTLCPNDCRPTSGVAGSERWVSVDPGEFAVFSDTTSTPPDVGPIDIPREWERYRWYEVEGTSSNLRWYPEVPLLASDVITFEDSLGRKGIIEPIERGTRARLRWTGTVGRDPLAGDGRFTILRTRAGWRVFDRAPSGVVRTSGPGGCSGDLKLNPSTSDWTIASGTCSGTFLVDEVVRKPNATAPALVNAQKRVEVRVDGASLRINSVRSTPAGICASLEVLSPDTSCSGLASDDPDSCGVHWAMRSSEPHTTLACGYASLDQSFGVSCQATIQNARTFPAGVGDQDIASAVVVRVAGQYRRTYYADAGGRIVRLVEPDGTVEDHNFDTEGRLVAQRSGFGVRTCQDYDARWNLVKSTRLPVAGRWSPVDKIEQLFGYDSNGDLVSVSVPGAPTTVAVSIVRDTLGREQSVSVPSTGLQVTRTFQSGYLSSEENSGGHKIRYEYLDSSGLPSRITEGYQSTTPRITTISHDVLGRPFSSSVPGEAPAHASWTPGGFLQSQAIDHDLSPTTPDILVTFGRDARGRRASTTLGNRHTEWDDSPKGLLQHVKETSALAPGIERHSCYRYGPTGLVEASVDPTGRSIRWTRDPMGRVIAIDRGVWASSGLLWDAPCASAIPTALIGQTERVYSATYTGAVLTREVTGTSSGVIPWSSDYLVDGYGRVVERRLGDGSVERYGYAADGSVSWEALYTSSAPALPTTVATWEPSTSHSALKAWRKFQRDRAGRVTRVDRAWFVDPPSAARILLGGGWTVETITYNDAQAEVTYTNADGRSTVVRRDALGRVVYIQYPDGLATQTLVYSADGRTVIDTMSPAATPSGSLITTRTYTPTLRLAEMSSSAMGISPLKLEYDALDRPTRQIRPDGRYQVTYGPWGEVNALRVADLDNVYQDYQTYNYDLAGRLSSALDVTGAKWTYTYDALGRLSEEKSPTNALSTFQYRVGTSSPRLAETPDSTTTMIYDARRNLKEALGYRPSAVAAWRESRAVFNYGPTGLVSATNYNKSTTNADDITTTYVRDSLGYPYERALTGWPTTTSIISTPAGNMQSSTANGRTITYYRDALNRPLETQVDGQPIFQATYSGIGEPQVVWHGNDVTESLTYDEALRLRERDVFKNSVSYLETETWWGRAGAPVRVDQWKSGSGQLTSEIYRTDEAGRLTGAWHDLKNLPVPAAASGFIYQSQADAWVASTSPTRYELTEVNAVERWSKRIVDGVSVNPSYAPDHRYSAWNSMVTTDAVGRTTTLEGTNYGYDGFGRIVSATRGGTSSEFLSDAWGRVVTWSSGAGLMTGSYEYGESGISREMRNFQNGTKEEQQYAYGHRLFPAALIRPSAKVYLHGTSSQRIDLVTSDAGTILEQVSWLDGPSPRFKGSSGSTTGSQNGVSTPYLGAPYFASLGVHKLGARWFSPEIGAFLAPDPSGLTDGPNSYIYGRAHPVMHSDPSGLTLRRTLEGLHTDLDGLGRELGAQFESPWLNGLVRWGVTDLGGIGVGFASTYVDTARGFGNPVYALGFGVRRATGFIDTYHARGVLGIVDTALPVDSANTAAGAAADAAADGDTAEAVYQGAKATTAVVQIVTTLVGGVAVTKMGKGSAKGTATVLEHEGRHASIVVKHGDTVLHTEQLVDFDDGMLTTVARVADAAPIVRSVTVPLPDAASAIQYQGSVIGRPMGRYNAVTNSCVTHCSDVLRAGGVEGIPNTTRGLVVWLRKQ